MNNNDVIFLNNVIIVIMIIIKLLSALNCIIKYKFSFKRMFAIVNWTVCKRSKVIQQL